MYRPSLQSAALRALPTDIGRVNSDVNVIYLHPVICFNVHPYVDAFAGLRRLLIQCLIGLDVEMLLRFFQRILLNFTSFAG